MPLVSFYTPENIRNFWFSDVFRGHRKRSVTLNGLICNFTFNQGIINFCRKKSRSEKYSSIHKKSGVQYSITYNFTKTEFNHRFFPLNFAKYFRAVVLKNTGQRLPLYVGPTTQF